MINNEIKRGVHYLAGEIGHMVINPLGRDICNCGSRGCFEAMLYEKRLLKKVLVPLDGSFKSETVIPYICNIALKLQMEMTLLQVMSKNGNSEADARLYLDSLRSKIKDLVDVTIDCQVSSGSVADTIIDLADELTVDLVAMSTRGMNRNNPLSLGSVAQKVFLAGNTPLLLIRK